jgi:hypothetical protein
MARIRCHTQLTVQQQTMVIPKFPLEPNYGEVKSIIF